MAQVVVESALAGKGDLEGSEFRAGVVERNGDGGALNVATLFPFRGRSSDRRRGACCGGCRFLGRGISTGQKRRNEAGNTEHSFGEKTSVPHMERIRQGADL